MAVDSKGRTLSEDGKCFWNGSAWQYVSTDHPPAPWRDPIVEAMTATTPEPTPPGVIPNSLWSSAPGLDELVGNSLGRRIVLPTAQNRYHGPSVIWGVVSMTACLIPLLGSPIAIAGILANRRYRTKGVRREWTALGTGLCWAGLVVNLLVTGVQGSLFIMASRP